MPRPRKRRKAPPKTAPLIAAVALAACGPHRPEAVPPPVAPPQQYEPPDAGVVPDAELETPIPPQAPPPPVLPHRKARSGPPPLVGPFDKPE